MKIVIFGREYNTKTSQKIAEWQLHKNAKNDCFYRETLYQIDDDIYFLHCQRKGEQYILPLSRTNVRSWCGNKLELPSRQLETTMMEG